MEKSKKQTLQLIGICVAGIAIICALMALTAYQNRQENIDLGDGISLHAKENELAIALPETQGTGYVWQAEVIRGVLEQVQEQHTTNLDEAVGKPTTHVYIYNMQGTEDAVVWLTYGRANQTPEKTHTLILSIKDGKLANYQLDD